MNYAYLGKTGIQISKLSFGTMTFGGEADEATSFELYKRCREAGINLFDCANIYTEGRAEEILGKLISHERHEVILTTKVYFPTNEDINSRGLSRRHIMHAVEQSLTRLSTDYIDIYFMHHFDENTPLEESLRAMSDLVHQGKVLYLGVSNFSAWQIMKALSISEKEQLPEFVCVQPMYNLVKRQAEVEILPMALSEQLGVLSYSPLAAGLLSGKYLSGDVSEGRLKENAMYQTRYGEPGVHEIAERFVRFAEEQGYSPMSLAIAWSASHPAVTSPILGARNVQQLEGCLQCLEINMTSDLRNAISALSVEPPIATDRNEEVQQRIG